MYKYLGSLCRFYSQDFESIFETNVGPVDVFRYKHTLEEQKKLVSEMEIFFGEVQAGTKTDDDLVKMGIEYIPSEDGSWDWFREAMEYLKQKIAEG